jgi:hypothetical protein
VRYCCWCCPHSSAVDCITGTAYGLFCQCLNIVMCNELHIECGQQLTRNFNIHFSSTISSNISSAAYPAIASLTTFRTSVSSSCLAVVKVLHSSPRWSICDAYRGVCSSLCWSTRQFRHLRCHKKPCILAFLRRWNPAMWKVLVFQSCAEPQYAAPDMAQQCDVLDDPSEGVTRT